ncbi:MAG: hypothetical protein HYT61_03650 [Candidatus Yanofskybacteria bacterium]|nr:hypothetical protein [Candidatus Yanofskybacteria bacterium]
MSGKNRNPFIDEGFWARVNKRFSEQQKEFVACPKCVEKIEYGDLASHELKHVLHPPLKIRVKKNISKVVPVVLFWGFWILLVWWLMARNHTVPDLNTPIDPTTERQEDICPNGYPC